MKACIVLAAILTIVVSGPVHDEVTAPEDGTKMEYFLVETSKGVYEVEDLVNAELDTRASETDLTYHFFSNHDQVRGTKIRSNNLAALRDTEFKASKDTLFVIHGWKASNLSDINHQVRGTILSKHDINLFVVDWSPLAQRNYISARNAVVRVGNYIAEFIKSLGSIYGVKLSQVSFVGHSLGAHISGNAGAALNGEVDHIVGLDPALPLFSYNNINDRVDPTDAKYVQIIHTNGGLLGFSASIGHSDYFPNGGSSQPGCGLDLAGGCSHSRAYDYYSESILASNGVFTSSLCPTYREFTRGSCSSNQKSFMGRYGVDTEAKGDYYLDTNRQSPFAQG